MRESEPDYAFEDVIKDMKRPGCSKLSGRELYRIRQGRYRILYSIKDRELLIHVIRIAHRKTVYR